MRLFPHKTTLRGTTVLILGVATMNGWLALAGIEGPKKTLRGEVVALNLTETPSVIVLKVQTAKKEELILGATVQPGTKMSRGTKTIGLDAIQLGEVADVTYVITPDGPSAQSIHVR